MIISIVEIIGLILGGVAALFSALSYFILTKRPKLEMLYNNESVKNKTFFLPQEEVFELPLSVGNSGNKTVAEPFYVDVSIPEALYPFVRALNYKAAENGIWRSVDPCLQLDQKTGNFYGWIKTRIFPKSHTQINQLYVKPNDAENKTYELQYCITWDSGEEKGSIYLGKS